MSKISILKKNPENWLSRRRYSPCESDSLTTAPGAHVGIGERWSHDILLWAPHPCCGPDTTLVHINACFQ